jgi:hypothetical protein
MTVASVILTRASILLLDEEYVRWTLPELVGWLNEGVGAICLAKPDASSETRAVSLGLGTLQTLPILEAPSPKPVRLLRVVRNLKSDGPPVGGRIIAPTARETLDAEQPYWHDSDQVPFKKEVRQFVFSDDDPSIYYVYPGNDGTGLVEVVMATIPTAVAATGDVNALGSYSGDVGLLPLYDVALVDYVCYRAQSKDDDGAMPGRAAAHYGQFASAVGIKLQTDARSSPSNQAARG